MQLSSQDLIQYKSVLSDESKKIHHKMLIACVIIFPVFALFDLYTFESADYWLLTKLRFFITALIVLGIVLEKYGQLNHRFVSFFALMSLSLFCIYATFVGGLKFAYKHHIADTTVFIAASLFVLWQIRYSILVVVVSVVFYFLMFLVFSISIVDMLTSGGALFLTIVVLHPVLVAYRLKTYKETYFYNVILENKNKELQQLQKLTDEKNKELSAYKEELESVNSHLEEVVRERTEKLELSYQKELSMTAELDRYLYSTYHDLKSPIARMKGLSMLMKDEQEVPIIKEYNDYVLESIIDMENLMEKFNYVYQLKTYEVKVEQVNLHDIILPLFEKYKAQHYQQNAKLFCPEIYIDSDKYLIFHIFNQLVKNSFQFKSPNRDLIITISKQNDSDQDFIIDYKDNGSGIEEIYLQQMFQMFFRASEFNSGHGLGLYMVEKSIEKLNAKISPESILDKFTIFSIEFQN